MRQWVRVLESLKIAVPLLIAIAAVLAWWFQALLAFLAVARFMPMFPDAPACRQSMISIIDVPFARAA